MITLYQIRIGSVIHCSFYYKFNIVILFMILNLKGIYMICIIPAS